MSAMATYYRVNLRDKQNNIVYPNVHNKWTFSSNGSLNISSGSITLQNGDIKVKGNILDLNGGMIYVTLTTNQNISGAKTFTNHIYLNGITNSTVDSTSKIIFGNSTTPYIVLRANTSKQFVISDSLIDNTYSIEYSRNETAFSSTTSEKISLGTSSKRWSSIYVNWGKFYGDIERVVNEMDVTLNNNNITNSIYPTTFCILDKNNRIVNRLECIPHSNGSIDSYWYLRNYKTDGTMVTQKGIRMSMNKSGTLTYSVADPANFRSAISAVNKAGDTMTGALNFSGDNSRNLTWNDGTYWQRIHTVDDSTVNTSVFEFQQTTNSGSSWSTLATIRDNGHFLASGLIQANGARIISNNSSGGDATVEFLRGNNADWRIINSGGDLHFQTNWTDSKQSSYHSVATLYYKNNRLWVKTQINVEGGRVTFSGDASVRNFFATNITTWNNNYSKYLNGTIAFCW